MDFFTRVDTKIVHWKIKVTNQSTSDNIEAAHQTFTSNSMWPQFALLSYMPLPFVNASDHSIFVNQTRNAIFSNQWAEQNYSQRMVPQTHPLGRYTRDTKVLCGKVGLEWTTLNNLSLKRNSDQQTFSERDKWQGHSRNYWSSQ